jgi:hypothetical protein
MKAFLMYRDRDFDPQQKLPPNEQELTQDLEINTLFNAMALGGQSITGSGKESCGVQFKRCGRNTISPRHSSGLSEECVRCEGYLRYRCRINR